MKRLPFVLFALFLLVSVVPFTFSQTKAKGEDELREKESGAAGHMLWFMEGRTLPDGSPAAKYVSEAHKQKMALRKANAARMNAARTMAADIPTAANGSSAWSPIGPSPIADDGVYGRVGGRVDAVAVDPTDSTGNTVYVGGAFGGLWKTTNGATPTASAVAWTPLLDQQATLSVGAIAVKPDNGSVVLVGTGENKLATDSYYGLGILRSVDGGATWTRIVGDQEGHTFLGLGFGRITFSTLNPNLVVAATGISAKGGATGLSLSQGGRVGLYYSTDAGATWHAATMSDGVLEYAYSVIYNAPAGKFFASVRFHGIYSSSNGITWTRLANQPNPTTVTLAACPTTTSTPSACPFVRGELAARADSNDMFVWFASSVLTDVDTTTGDGGVWRSKDGGASWTPLDMTGVNNCDAPGETQDACGVYQAYFYNMYVGVAPNPSNVAATDVYIGSGNIFKCTLDANHTTCANTELNPNRWMNLTRVYGCKNIPGTIASVHPDQHNIAFTSGSVAYFVNDGGVYRARNTGALIDDSCTSVVPFDNLNNYPLSLTQFVWGTPHTTDSEAFMGGAQDVGTSVRTSSTWGTTQKTWLPLPVGGDGGYNAFSGSLLLQSWDHVSVNICNLGLNCPAAASQTNWKINFVQSSTLGNDDSAFYMPWMLDPRDNTKIILGTCRVWRGPVSFTASFAGTALSQKLSDVSGQANCGSFTDATNTKLTDRYISALSAGGPATPSGGSSVIYAALANGSIFRTTSSDTIGNWADITPSPSLNPGPNWLNRPPFKISALWVDRSVSTGLTVYATVQGFSTPHVLKSTDGGLSWTNISGNLPDAPVNSITTDPDDATNIYVGTDTGVYSTTNNGANWVEVGPNEVTGGAYLPNVPVTRVTIFKGATKKYLYAVTYGRGVWRVDLNATAALPVLSFNPNPVTFGSSPVGVSAASQTLTITNTGTATLTVSTAVNVNSPEFTSNPATVNGCPNLPTTLAPGAFCDLSVTFTPTAIGVRTGSMTVTDNTAAGTDTVNFSGTGTAPPQIVSINPETWDFGYVGTSTTVSKTFTLTNNTASTLNIASAVVTGTAYSKDAFSTCAATLGNTAGSNTCTIKVNFAPVTNATYPGTLTVTHSATGSPIVVSLTAIAETPIVSATPNPLAFGGKPINTANASQAITITNTSHISVPIQSVLFSPATGDFTETHTGCSSLAGGASCAVNVTFNTNTTGTKSATLIIATLGATPPTVAVTGTGEDFNPPTSDKLSATVTAGSAATFAISVAPKGGSFTNAITLTCAGLPARATCAFAPTTLTPGATAASTILTLATTRAGNSNVVAENRDRRVPYFAFWMGLPGMVLLPLAGVRTLKRNKVALLAMLFIALVMVLAMTACGGGGSSSVTPPPTTPGTPVGTYTVQVVATSGGITQTTPITLTVQ